MRKGNVNPDASIKFVFVFNAYLYFNNGVPLSAGAVNVISAPSIREEIFVIDIFVGGAQGVRIPIELEIAELQYELQEEKKQKVLQEETNKQLQYEINEIMQYQNNNNVELDIDNTHLLKDKENINFCFIISSYNNNKNIEKNLYSVIN